MATTGFIQLVKTQLSITHDYLDPKISEVIDEAIEYLNAFKETEVDETTMSKADKRLIYIYVTKQLDGRNDLQEALAQQIEHIREK